MLMRQRGFSLVELMVAVAIGSLLIAAALPSFSTWITNARIRSVADALQSGLRMAQVEAQRQAYTTVFFRTTSKDCSAGDTSAVASAVGQFWQIRTVPNPLVADDVARTLSCGVLSDVTNGLTLNGPAALCFNANGRQTASSNPAAVGVNCTPDAAGAASVFTVLPGRATSETRPLNVLVSIGGSVRMCDPNKTLSTSTPDGCP